jgi:hypothetical protein
MKLDRFTFIQLNNQRWQTTCYKYDSEWGECSWCFVYIHFSDIYWLTNFWAHPVTTLMEINAINTHHPIHAFPGNHNYNKLINLYTALMQWHTCSLASQVLQFVNKVHSWLCVHLVCNLSVIFFKHSQPCTTCITFNQSMCLHEITR